VLVSKNLLYKVAYDEAVRALSEQQAVIESFRTRAGLLFSAAAISASFLGSQALRSGRTSFASWLALVCFVAVAASSLAILWPRGWEDTANPREVIGNYIESEESPRIENLHRDLSLHMHSSYIENNEGVEQLATLFQIASCLLTLEVILWMIAIAVTF
jgi:hypothetical protein